MFKAYIASLHDDEGSVNPYSLVHESSVELSDPEHFRIACAFVAAGVCRFDRRGRLVSTDKAIDRAVVEQIDERVNGSVTRLAYAFIALNKPLPSGFVELCFKPHIVSAMVAHTGVSTAESVAVLDDLMASHAVSIKCESDVTLEHVMELKNRLRHMGLIEDAENDGINEGTKPRPDNKPRLPTPEPSQHYRCDSDDAWLIRYQVENHRFLKFGSDFVKRIQRWGQRNKRIIGLEVVEVLTFAIVTGVTTGGIGTAVYFGSKLAYKLLQIGWGALMDTIRTQLNKIRLRRVEAGVARLSCRSGEHLDSRELKDIALLDAVEDDEDDKTTRFLRFTESLPGNRITEDKHRAVTRLLDSTEYFARKRSLTRMANLMLDMKQQTDALSEQGVTAGDSVKDSVRFQQLQAVARAHSERFGEAVRDYDQMIVASVQKVTALNDTFEQQFTPLWEPFKEMPAEQVGALFNEAAGHSSVRGRWYLPKEDNFGWIQSVVKEEPGNASSRRIRECIAEAVALQNQTPQDHNVTSNKVRRKVVQATLEGRDLLISYARSRLQLMGLVWVRAKFYALVDRVISLPASLTSGGSVGAAFIKPILSPVWAAVYVFLYVAEKVTTAINNKRNRKRNQATQERINAEGNNNLSLSVDDWLAMRRQAKHLGPDYVKNVKRLMKVLDTMQALSAEQATLDKASPEYRDFLVRTAAAMLRYKMLMHELQAQLYGAVGLMHHASMQYKSQFDRRLQCIQVAD
ncbi:hypothetical protein GCM10023116_26400 [Kistimonas scapharcae]|uniref:Uncharacterized protein n=2 Tax=Kistimonas scapharcae TaxID=1036133 RepID=A0ABP8V5Z5_9GAMM